MTAIYGLTGLFLEAFAVVMLMDLLHIRRGPMRMLTGTALLLLITSLGKLI